MVRDTHFIDLPLKSLAVVMGDCDCVMGMLWSPWFRQKYQNRSGNNIKPGYIMIKTHPLKGNMRRSRPHNVVRPMRAGAINIRGDSSVTDETKVQEPTEDPTPYDIGDVSGPELMERLKLTATVSRFAQLLINDVIPMTLTQSRQEAATYFFTALEVAMMQLVLKEKPTREQGQRLHTAIIEAMSRIFDMPIDGGPHG